MFNRMSLSMAMRLVVVAALCVMSASARASVVWSTVTSALASSVTAQVPRAPIGVTGTDAGQGSVRLAWTDQNAGAYGHVIERIPQLGAAVSVAAGTSQHIDATAGNGTHEYRVGARNATTGAIGWSAWIIVPVTSGTAGSGVGAPSSEGWTPLLQSADSRVIYVSASEGADSNSGLSSDAPLRTIAAGYAKLRHNFPDWLLLKRGDTFLEPLGFLKKSGRSSLEPLVIGTYGSHPQRPRVLAGTGNAISRAPGGGTPPKVENIAIVGIHFSSSNRTSASGGQGLSWVGGGGNLLIEDCMFEAFGFGISIDGYDSRVQNVTLKRTLVVDSYLTSFHSSGLYAQKVDNLTIEECVFDHNGWKAGEAPATIFNHNIYVDMMCTNLVMQGNIIADASSHGAQMRPGGVCNGNLFVRNPIALQMGFGGLAAGADSDPEQPAVIDCRRNVFLEGRNIAADLPRGWGLVVQWATGGTVTENVFAGNTGGYPSLIELDGSRGAGVFQIVIHNNVAHNWHGPMRFTGDATKVNNNTVTSNIVQNPGFTNDFLMEHNPLTGLGLFTMGNNRYFRGGSTGGWFQPGNTLSAYRASFGDTTSTVAQVPLVASGRTIATYNQSVGGSASYEDYMAQVRQQSRFNWREQYRAAPAIAYIRAGFTPQ
jgi:Right handed beta helix region